MAKTPPSGHVHGMSPNWAKAYDDAMPSPAPTAAAIITTAGKWCDGVVGSWHDR
jgi:hypothetical protein